jgi:hypothetical protein
VAWELAKDDHQVQHGAAEATRTMVSKAWESHHR